MIMMLFLIGLLVVHNAHATNQTCHVGTPCAAHYSASGMGCCPYDGAVCCPNQQTCCPAGSTCQDSGAYATTCVGAPASEAVGLSVCKPGAVLPLSTTKKNVLIIGDSVSIGYTPWVARHMADLPRRKVELNKQPQHQNGREQRGEGQ